MIIIGADYHPGFQQIAFVDTDTAEFQERGPAHAFLPNKKRVPRPSRTLFARGGGAFSGLSAARPLLFTFVTEGAARRPALAFSRLTNLF